VAADGVRAECPSRLFLTLRPDLAGSIAAISASEAVRDKRPNGFAGCRYHVAVVHSVAVESSAGRRACPRSHIIHGSCRANAARAARAEARGQFQSLHETPGLSVDLDHSPVAVERRLSAQHGEACGRRGKGATADRRCLPYRAVSSDWRLCANQCGTREATGRPTVQGGCQRGSRWSEQVRAMDHDCSPYGCAAGRYALKVVGRGIRLCRRIG
jgi:hypothetical protein